MDERGRGANRARWDEAAPLHAASPLYDLDGFRAGRDDIRPFEVDELFHEQACTNCPWPWLERGPDGYFRLPAVWPRFPLTYSVRARRRG